MQPTDKTPPAAGEPLPAKDKLPLINSHAHIFTGDHVPPFLAKTFLPLRLDVLMYIPALLGLVRWWYRVPATWPFKPRGRKIARSLYKIRILIVRSYLLALLSSLLTVYTFFIVYNWFPRADFWPFTWVNWVQAQIEKLWPQFLLIPLWVQIPVLLALLLFYPSGRQAIFFVFNRLWTAVKKLPGPQTREMLRRYWNIVRFARYLKQGEGLEKLRAQYPAGTAFVILPMDTEFMEAGTPTKPYLQQMEELKKIRRHHPKEALPFVFADPRRIKQDPTYFAYTAHAGTVTLTDCFVKEYIEEHKFRGIKIYPALGYYPFDEALLPLWKYAADNQLPIMTHCVRGPMFYRGAKEKEWDNHPIFEPGFKTKPGEKLLLPQMKNVEFSANFTHPLNYLCLVEEVLLRRVVANTAQPVKDLFGYTNPETPLLYDLRHLKICMAHFGGQDEWDRYFDKDRYGHSNQLAQYPEHGIDFLTGANGQPAPGKPEQIWRHTDWYSIICSLMLQYDNVYADISYILHNDAAILPLLKQTLQNPGMRKKVLYGTDFFVVRNHKSDKNMLTDMMGGLDVDDFDMIARTNPRKYLATAIHGDLPF